MCWSIKSIFSTHTHSNTIQRQHDKKRFLTSLTAVPQKIRFIHPIKKITDKSSHRNLKKRATHRSTYTPFALSWANPICQLIGQKGRCHRTEAPYSGGSVDINHLQGLGVTRIRDTTTQKSHLFHTHPLRKSRLGGVNHPGKTPLNLKVYISKMSGSVFTHFNVPLLN